MKVSIIYGGFEGPLHGKKLERALVTAGYEMSRPQDADIIIAHSGGCFMLPAESKANLIMLVGVPYWPGRSLTASFRTKLKTEKKNPHWLKKTIFNTYYLVTRPRRWVLMYKAVKAQNWPVHKDVLVLAIRNQSDSFMHPTLVAEVANKNGWSTKQLDGQHDDLWLNPAPYVALIDASLKTKSPTS